MLINKDIFWFRLYFQFILIQNKKKKNFLLLSCDTKLTVTVENEALT